MTSYWLITGILFEGICIWSPPLDRYGNSCRGQHFMETMKETFSFHDYESAREGSCTEVKINPTMTIRESRGDTIVSLLYAAADGDISTLKTHKVRDVLMKRINN